MKKFFTQILSLLMVGSFSLQAVAQEGDAPKSTSIPVLNGTWQFTANPESATNPDLFTNMNVKLRSEAFHGFDSKGECNYYNQADITNTFWYAPGWNQTDDPVMEIEGSSYTLFFPTATSDEWQNQCFWRTDIPTSEDGVYDFSVRLLSDKDISRVVLKLFHTDEKAYFYEKIALKAGEEYVFYKTGLTGLQTDGLNLVLDFGSNPDNTTVTVSDLVFQNTGCDGVVPPTEAEDDETINLKYDTPSNLWKTLVDDKGEEGFDASFWYAPGWNQIDDPEFTYSKGAYTMKFPAATYEQWQAQCKFTSQIELDAEKVYDFGITLVCNKPTKGTVKVADAYNDKENALALFDNVNLKEGVNVLKMGNLVIPNSAEATMLILDFGGCPAGLEVTAKDVILQEHKDHDYNAETNLWKTNVEDAEGAPEYSFYYAPGWNQLPNPEVTRENGTYSLTLPQATSDQWQAQFHLIPANMSLSKDKKYYYSVTIESNNEFFGATVKMTDKTSDANFLPGTDQRQAVKVGKNVFEFGNVTVNSDASMKIAFDFGGCPDATNITISNIIVEEMEEETNSGEGGEGTNEPKVEGYTATLIPAEGEAIELKGCTFDGTTLTIPFKNVKVANDEKGDIYMAGRDAEGVETLDAAVEFKYVDAYTMQLQNGMNYAYVEDIEAEDPFLREEGAVAYANCIAEGQLTMPRPAEKFDFTGTWETTVVARDDFGQTEFDFTTDVDQKGTITIQKIEKKLYVTSFFGYNTEAISGGIPCTTSRDGNVLHIQPGGILKVLNEETEEMAVLYDSNSPELTIDMAVNEDGTVTITDFTVFKMTLGGEFEDATELVYISCSELEKVDNTDAIDGVKADNMAKNAIYTIAGQRVNKVQKGLYIVNGQKVVVK